MGSLGYSPGSHFRPFLLSFLIALFNFLYTFCTFFLSALCIRIMRPFRISHYAHLNEFSLNFCALKFAPFFDLSLNLIELSPLFIWSWIHLICLISTAQFKFISSHLLCCLPFAQVPLRAPWTKPWILHLNIKWFPLFFTILIYYNFHSFLWKSNLTLPFLLFQFTDIALVTLMWLSILSIDAGSVVHLIRWSKV